MKEDMPDNEMKNLYQTVAELDVFSFTQSDLDILRPFIYWRYDSSAAEHVRTSSHCFGNKVVATNIKKVARTP